MNFILFSVFSTSLFWIMHVLAAVFVVRFNMKVNYTRKMIHFSIFALHVWGTNLFPHDVSLPIRIWGALVSVSSILIFLPQIRNRLAVVRFAFRSVDRPEDQPYTFVWLVVQLLAMYLFLIPLGHILSEAEMGNLIWIPLLISCFGDGLAEPVGVAFGRHHYQVKALFTHRLYHRTYEGSACVFVSAIIACWLYREYFSSSQFLILLIIAPALATIAEAKSPHTVDQPFIVGLIGLLVYLVKIYI